MSFQVYLQGVGIDPIEYVEHVLLKILNDTETETWNIYVFWF